ncbi:MAG TPA: fibronectin type III domain-containing protein, partial [Thermoanaerobaculia bacterium]|nr:fibronectin type III domain-containing protein [Thermoanaerobaculia bacterium]
AQGPRTILPGSQYGAYVGNLLWNGSEFVIALTSSTDPTVAHSDSRLLRISRTGELLDDSMILPSRSRDIISNGTEYLITILPGSFVRIPFGSTTQIVSADPVRSIDTQQAIAIAGGRRDYLASWLETDRGGLTIRAARIDAQGRYLDGAGIVIASLPAADRPQQSVSVDSDGENWLVVWSDQSGGIHGVRVSSDGVLLDPQPIAIPGGYGASVRWGRDSWMVVSTDGSRLISTMVARNGLVGAPVFFDQVQAPDRGAPYSPTPFVYGNPSLAFDGQQFVVAAAIDEGYCTAETCVGATAVVTERIDLAGNSVAGSMFIAPPAEYRERSMPVATNGSQDLVVFQQDYKIVGLLSNKGSAPMTMPIAEDGANATVMWDGSEFVVALTSHKEGVSQLVRVSTLGVVDSTLTLPHDPDEFSFGLAFPPSVPAELKTSPATGLPLAFLTQHDAYDAVPRAAFLLAGDAQESMVTQQVPPAPSINGAIGDRDGATLSWAPQDHVLGFSIELRQPDGSERVIGVAAGSATSAHVSYAGLQGTAVRLRAWNAAGLSSPSSEVQPTTRRRAAR